MPADPLGEERGRELETLVSDEAPAEPQKPRRRWLPWSKALVAAAVVALAVAAMWWNVAGRELAAHEGMSVAVGVQDDAVGLSSVRRRRRSGSSGAVSLVNMARRRRRWGLVKGLKHCHGDCNWELKKTGDQYITRDNCPGNSKCFRWGLPPGCKGKPLKGWAYCYNDPHTVLMLVSKKRSRTDFEILLSHAKTPRTVDMIAYSNKDLTYHYNKAKSATGSPQHVALMTGGRRRVGKYKHVIIQEYTRIPPLRERDPTGWEESMESVKGLDKMIRAHGARTVFFQTWGKISDWDEEVPIIEESHLQYYDMLSSRRRATYTPLIAPVGHAYDLWKKEKPTRFLELWEGDLAHESELARYYTALVLYETVTGDNCDNLPGPADMKMSASDRELLQKLAHQAVLDTRESIKTRHPDDDAV